MDEHLVTHSAPLIDTGNVSQEFPQALAEKDASETREMSRRMNYDNGFYFRYPMGECRTR